MEKLRELFLKYLTEDIVDKDSIVNHSIFNKDIDYRICTVTLWQVMDKFDKAIRDYNEIGKRIKR